jgi:hypothetical protein
MTIFGVSLRSGPKIAGNMNMKAVDFDYNRIATTQLTPLFERNI